MFFLIQNHSCWKKLVDEVRNSYKNFEEVAFASLAKLQYLDGIVYESNIAHLCSNSWSSPSSAGWTSRKPSYYPTRRGHNCWSLSCWKCLRVQACFVLIRRPMYLSPHGLCSGMNATFQNQIHLYQSGGWKGMRIRRYVKRSPSLLLAMVREIALGEGLLCLS